MVCRILIKGGSGAGKSTLARVLADRLAVPYIELDSLHHGPNWTAATADELRDRVRANLNDERGWVVDGNFDSKLGTLVLDRADLIVWLDLSLITKLRRLAWRTARRWFSSEELWNGNRETLKDALWGQEALFAWVIRTHFRYRRDWTKQFNGRRVVRLTTPAEVKAWLMTFACDKVALAGVSEVPAEVPHELPQARLGDVTDFDPTGARVSEFLCKLTHAGKRPSKKISS